MSEVRILRGKTRDGGQGSEVARLSEAAEQTCGPNYPPFWFMPSVPITIAVDAMGDDPAARCEVNGAVLAAEKLVTSSDGSVR